jgi:ABC-2 type transport system ATP-binding protein
MPTAGTLQVGGRVGALIEVRAGIHPELSGRENIYFYGTVLGLSRRQVADRFDDIVDFGELGHAVDRQVKFYSSGMQMRLGFSIAAFLEPDILLVDEALAVGDVGFQQRCLERMRTVLQQGTSLVFVSHDMAAVESMCERSVWMDAGVIRHDGPTAEVLNSYRMGLEEKAAALGALLDDAVRLVGLRVSGPDGHDARTGEDVTLELTLEARGAVRADVCVGVTDGPANPIFALTESVALLEGRNVVRVTAQSLPLPRGRYYVWIGAFTETGTEMAWHPAGPLDVTGPRRAATPRGVMVHSPIHVPARWDTQGEVVGPAAEPGPAGERRSISP